MTDDSPYVPFGGKAVGVTCTICCIEFESRDERLEHWLDDHGDILPKGFADRVGTKTDTSTLTPACGPYTGTD